MNLRASAMLRAVLTIVGSVSLPMGADLVEVLPVTSRILQLHYDEGHVDYYGVNPVTSAYDQDINSNRSWYSPLDTVSARNVANYSITSIDDGNHTTAEAPAHIGYYGKGAEFNWPWKQPNFMREYWVYLTLPTAMVRGKSYVIGVNNLADNVNKVTFTFNESVLRSPTIHTSLVGYTTSSPKYAYLSQWMGSYSFGGVDSGALDLAAYASAQYHVVDAASGQKVKTYAGGIVLQKSKATTDITGLNWTKADVWECDFSDFITPGRYKIVVDGMGSSYPFEIRDNIYRDAFYVACRGLYFQRQGIVKRIDEYADKVYPRSHHYENNKHFYDPNQRTDDHNITGFDFASHPVTGIWGHYYDAGDWDMYTVHWNVPLMLMISYVLNPKACRDGDIANKYKLKETDALWIDEGTNGIPDLLDEAGWLVAFGKRTRKALQDAEVGTGGVPVYVGREAGASQPSWTDTRDMAVKAEMPDPTFYYAANAALYAHCLNVAAGGTSPSAAGWIAEAKSAYDWAVAALAGDTTLNRSSQIAAVALYLVTGDAAYQDVYKAISTTDSERFNGSWSGIPRWSLAAGIYLVSCAGMPNLDLSHYAWVKSMITGKANGTTTAVPNRGFRVGGIEAGQWSRMGMLTTPRLFFAAVIHHLTGDQKYLDAMHTSMAYFTGGNQRNTVTMSGLGIESERQPFHPDSWFLLDFNSPVYRNPILPGFSVYNTTSFDVNGHGSEKGFARPTAIPAWQSWPEGEMRIDSRWSIAGSEFTIHQNNMMWIMAASYLINKNDSFTPSGRPTVAVNLVDGNRLSRATPVSLSVSASPDAELVKYYYDWHYIGESRAKAERFALTWDIRETQLSSSDTTLITAVCYNAKGMMSLPSSEADARVIITDAITAVHNASVNGQTAVHLPGRLGIGTRTLRLPASTGTARLYDLRGRLVWEYQKNPVSSELCHVPAVTAKGVLCFRCVR